MKDGIENTVDNRIGVMSGNRLDGEHDDDDGEKYDGDVVDENKTKMVIY